MPVKNFCTFCCSIAACLLMISTTSAEDSTQQKNPQNKSQAKAAQQWIDQLSSKVDLTSDQKSKIREQLNANGQKVASTWNKFTEANAKAIALEALMYAAIEDGMNDQQKQQFRQNRKNKQQAEKSTNNQEARKTAKQKENRQRDDQQPGTANDSSSKERKKGSQQNAKSDKQSKQKDSAYVYVTEMIIVPVQKLASDVGMDEQQRRQCDQACQQFHSKLHEAYSDIQRYHDQLVELEAEKMLAVEKVLNEEQLQKLKKDRSGNEDSSNQTS